MPAAGCWPSRKRHRGFTGLAGCGSARPLKRLLCGAAGAVPAVWKTYRKTRKDPFKPPPPPKKSPCISCDVDDFLKLLCNPARLLPAASLIIHHAEISGTRAAPSRGVMSPYRCCRRQSFSPRGGGAEERNLLGRGDDSLCERRGFGCHCPREQGVVTAQGSLLQRNQMQQSWR